MQLSLTVTGSVALSPHMQRLKLTAPELVDFGYLPGQDVMLLVATDGDRPVRRRYSIRALDPKAGLLTLDIVRHSEGPEHTEGPGERWVRTAGPGVTIEGIGPRGKVSPAAEADWHLFIGDESALAAIFSMAESLPPEASATVILEVPEAADEQDLHAQAEVRLSWLHRGGQPAGDPDALLAAAQAVPIPAGRPHAYLIGEAKVVSRLRETLAGRGFAPEQISPKAYWGRGKANENRGEPARDG
ncbi:MAG TPA: siderophore-interacting protein [Streptosporangiaceae bacterium]